MRKRLDRTNVPIRSFIIRNIEEKLKDRTITTCKNTVQLYLRKQPDHFFTILLSNYSFLVSQEQKNFNVKNHAGLSPPIPAAIPRGGRKRAWKNIGGVGWLQVGWRSLFPLRFHPHPQPKKLHRVKETRTRVQQKT